ncbi:MAG: hypothetical protein AB4042_15725 [Leptolyngbyaceae cyanobacterium]
MTSVQYSDRLMMPVRSQRSDRNGQIATVGWWLEHHARRVVTVKTNQPEAIATMTDFRLI